MKSTTLGKSGRFSAVTAVVVFIAVCLLAWYWSRGRPPEAAPWTSILPPLVAISLALATNKVVVSLFAGVLLGGVLIARGASSSFWLAIPVGLWHTGQTIRSVIVPDDFDPTNLQILAFVVLMMAMLGVMLACGGLQGIAQWLSRYARSPRSTQLVAVLLGLVVFIDDYANTMIVGPTMRPLTDRHRISREKLAFLVDATAAPIAGLAVVSTWIGYEVGLLGQQAADLKLGTDGYGIFFDAIGFRIYCLGMIAFLVWNVLSGQDFGPMAAAERRARQLGKPLADDARVLGAKMLSAAPMRPDAPARAISGLLPMLAVLLFFLCGLWIDGGGMAAMQADWFALGRASVWREALGSADKNLLLTLAGGFGLATAWLLALVAERISLGSALRATLRGSQAAILPVTILVLAWSLNSCCGQLRTGEYLAEMLKGVIGPGLYPPLVFVVACLASFSMGTSWGTMGILIPTALPVAFALDEGVYGRITVLAAAAILDGAIFGDHCSPISDTTILSSAAASCDHMAHVRTQAPYSLLVAALALLLGYIPAAQGAPWWLGLCAVTAASGAVLGGLALLRRNK